MARARWILFGAVVVIGGLVTSCGGSDAAERTDGTATPTSTASPVSTAPRPVGTTLVEFRPVLVVRPPQPGTTSLCEPGDPSAIAPSEPISANQCQDGVVTATYDLGPALLDGSAIESANASRGQNGEWIVNPVFREEAPGIAAFNAAAALCNAGGPDCPTQQLAIVVDGQVVSAPMINEPQFGRDQIQISGSFTESSAQDLAVRLSSS